MWDGNNGKELFRLLLVEQKSFSIAKIKRRQFGLISAREITG